MTEDPKPWGPVERAIGDAMNLPEDVAQYVGQRRVWRIADTLRERGLISDVRTLQDGEITVKVRNCPLGHPLHIVSLHNAGTD